MCSREVLQCTPAAYRYQDHVVADEIHYYFHILGNIIAQAIEMDARTNRKESDHLQGLNLQQLIKTLQMCCVPFRCGRRETIAPTLEFIECVTQKMDNVYNPVNT